MKRYLTPLLFIIGIQIATAQIDTNKKTVDTTKKAIEISQEIKVVTGAKPQFKSDSSAAKTTLKKTPGLIKPQLSTLSTGTIDAGRTAATLDVSASGGATFSVPFTLPPGLGNVVPQLGLIYNSQSGYGAAGYGWNISGLSAISRILSTVFHDGQISGVNFDEHDRFALDGQRLILKSGTYGADGAEYQTENYSNTKIISRGVSPYGQNYGPEYFEVNFADGSKAYYGLTPNSRTPADYAVTYTESPLGARINYHYAPNGNTLNISQITYGTLGSAPGINQINFNYISANRHEKIYMGGLSFYKTDILNKISIVANGINFRHYELNFDVMPLLNYQRLTSIQESDGGEIKAFDPIYFTYGSTGDVITSHTISNLSVQGIANNNSQVITSDFTGNGSMDFLLYPNAKDKFWAFYDLDPGSPYMQLGYQINTGYFRELFPATWLTHDNKILAGQGMIIAKDAPNNTYKFEMWSSGTVAPVYYQYDRIWNNVPLSPNYWDACENRSVEGKPLRFDFISGDFNGDGLTDVIAINDHNVVTSRIAADSVNNWNCTDVYGSMGSYAYFINMDRRLTSNYVINLGAFYETYSGTYLDKLYTADFNGDGKTDILHVTPNNVMYVYTMNNNNVLELLWQTSDSRITNNQPALIGDYNGDGKTDIMFSTGNNSLFATFMSNGSSFEKFENFQPFSNTAATWDGTPGIEKLDSYYLISNDIDGDGKTDIISTHTITRNNNDYGTANITVYHNIAAPGTLTSFVAGSSGSQYTNLNHYPIPVFLNPDKPNHKLEFGFMSNSSISLFKFSKDARTETQMTTISQDGVYHQIEYKPLMPNLNTGDIPLYQTSLDQTYPYIDLQSAPSVNVVSKLTRYFESEQVSQVFGYGKAVTHAGGLGFLGFSESIRSNWHVDESDENRMFNISINSPGLRGAPLKTFTTKTPYISSTIVAAQGINDGGTLSDYINRTDYTYNTQLLPSKVFVNATESVSTKDLLNQTNTLQTMEFDEYYNTTKSTSNFGGSGTKTIEVTYNNNPGSGYYIGRPLTSKSTLNNGSDSFTKLEEYSYIGFLPTTIKKKTNNTPFDIESLEYDIYGNVTQKTVTVPGGGQRTVSMAYDATGRFIVQTVDVEGLSTSFINDSSSGNTLSKTNPFNQTETYIYDSWGRLLTTTNYLGVKAYRSYVKSSYDAVVTDSDDEGRSKIQIVNSLGQIVERQEKTIDGQYIGVRIQYDVYGRQVGESELQQQGNYNQWNYTAYDEYGRVNQTTTFTGKVTNYSYNGSTATVNDGTKSVITIRNQLGQITSLQDPGGTVNYSYFANGNLKSSDFDGISQTIEQDGFGRKIKLTDPSAGVYQYEYDGFDQVTKEITPKGVTEYTFDGTGKVIQTTISGDDTNMQYSYMYHPTTKLLTSKSLINADGNNSTSTYNYDSYNRLTSRIEDNLHARFSRTYSYDTYGRVNAESNEAKNKLNNIIIQKTIEFQYQNGELLQTTLQGTGQVLWKIHSLDSKGRLSAALQGNALKTTFQYDSYGLPQQRTLDRISGTAANLMNIGYSFNSQRGLLNSRSNSVFGWNETFDYDNLDRLTNFNDNNGNNSQTYDARGRITSNDLGNYSYNGNTYKQSELELSSAADTYYQARVLQQISYNAFKSPVEIIEDGNERISFQYNAELGRSHMYYGGDQTDKMLRRYRRHYAEDGSMEITNDLQNGTTSFIFYLSGDAYTAPAIWKEIHSASSVVQNLYYLHRDYLGSIVMITDDSGTVMENRQFDAWGNVVKLTDGNGNSLSAFLITDRGFTGHEHLFGVGLIHMNGRLYDSKLHRFLSPDNYVQDPYNTQNFNRFGYVMNNPLKYTDPNGEFIFTVLAAIFAPPLLPWAIGADIGMWSGGSLANGTMNPFKWDYGSGKTWGYMLGGAVSGALSGGVGNSISAAGGAFANTLAIVASSGINSLGTYFYTGGKTDISVSFGVGSINLLTGEIGFLGKTGNSLMENIGYGLGAIANAQDILAGLKPGSAQVQTENATTEATAELPGQKDKIGHFQVLDEKGTSLIDFGPANASEGRYFGFSEARNNWTEYATAALPNPTKQTINIPGNLHNKAINIKGVNMDRLTKISNNLKSNPGSYNFLLNSCSSVGSRALAASGYFAIGGIHPYFIRASIQLRQLGLRPSLYSHFLNN
ncbi:RHS repeat-associated protein [Pedobacter sp. AK017]|uniref:FG-GAP-like repeat-containing protein n=1 Tax=Pedobacter sp. AK017 TaxID=2723073 RepID=UPI00160B3A6F|nr:FG-GAP-like repeat-containing protein [Pedobacter sp. AK017]MBB5440874.1 RHS repeat-associated protein [Pedobacter sp. AK017]